MVNPASPIDVSPDLFEEAGFLDSDIPVDARPNRPISLPAEDGRHFATEAIAKYIASWQFNVRSVGNSTKPLRLDPVKQILFEWPKDGKDLVMPVLVFETDGEPNHDFIGNTVFEEEGTADVFAPGTAVYEWAEHLETFKLHVFAPDKPTRRALIAGLEIIFNPVQVMSGFRLVLTKYFNHTVVVTMEGGGRVDDPDAVANRRKADFTVTMRFNKGMLANAVDFEPSTETTVQTPQEAAVAALVGS